jgi:phage baseplate assembly protein gpV
MQRNSGTSIEIIIDNPTARVSGGNVTLDQPATVLNGRTVVPARFIAENLGATVAWNESTRMVTVTRESTTIEIIIDNTTARVNGANVTLDQPATVLNGRTMVPARFIAENLGATVGWDGDTRTVTITSNSTGGATEFYPGTTVPTFASVIDAPIEGQRNGNFNSYACCLAHFDAYSSRLGGTVVHTSANTMRNIHVGAGLWREYEVGDFLVQMSFYGLSAESRFATINIDIVKKPDLNSYVPVYYPGSTIPTFGSFTGALLQIEPIIGVKNRYRYSTSRMAFFDLYTELLESKGFDSHGGRGLVRGFESDGIVSLTVTYHSGEGAISVEYELLHTPNNSAVAYYPGTSIPTFEWYIGRPLTSVWDGGRYYYENANRGHFEDYISMLESKGFTLADSSNITGIWREYRKDGEGIHISYEAAGGGAVIIRFWGNAD